MPTHQVLARDLAAAGYLAGDDVAVTCQLAIALGKPILAEGPPGTGKTALAKALAAALDRQLIRLQCYEGLDEARALYEWDYGKQLLYATLLKDAIAATTATATSLTEAADRLADGGSTFFSDRFLLARPVLQALTSPRPAILLIDELDRADEAFEAFLLEFLDEFQVSIPELGVITARHRPMVVLTSNNTRPIAEALRRRCLYLYLDYPDYDSELAIVRQHVPGLDAELAAAAVQFVQRLRRQSLRKPPSIAETLDWALALVTINARSISDSVLTQTLGVLLKEREDWLSQRPN